MLSRLSFTQADLSGYGEPRMLMTGKFTYLSIYPDICLLTIGTFQGEK